MSDERISLTLSHAQLAAIDNAMDMIESNLERVLKIGEEYDEDEDEASGRRTSRPFKPAVEARLGRRQEGFCRETLMRVVQNPHMDALDVAGASEALRALDQLQPRLVRLQRLGERASLGHSARSEHVMNVRAARLRIAGGGGPAPWPGAAARGHVVAAAARPFIAEAWIPSAGVAGVRILNA